ncbi:MAG: hypothetical protein IPJ24_14095 [bacterium]|nr:hypothetical protein [bacterium]
MNTTHTQPRRMQRSRRGAIAILLVLVGGLQASPALAAIARTVRWTASPAKNALGQPLPPAVSYEVWLTVQPASETMVATVPDTMWTLQAQPGTTYRVRVRGVSATGVKSVYSALSDPWQAPVASDADLPSMARVGPARPNPFIARTAITYLVPEGLATVAVLSLDIYDVRGRHIRDLEVDRSPGAHEAVWNGSDDSGHTVPAGIYLAQYTCGGHQSSLKLALVA